MFTSIGFTTTLLTLVIALKEVSSSGTLFIKFIQYTNPGGKGDNGHCCDGRGRTCPSQCDHYFRVCADTDSGSTSMDACAYGEIETNSVRNENNIDFRQISGIGSETPNPLAFPFERWTGSTSIKVKVYDSDDWTGDDFVDTLRGVIATSPSAFYSPVTLRARTSLELQVYIRCNRNWYGAGCDVHCVSRDDSTGHFRCQRQTGVKQCLPGWGGEVCDVNINECASSPCQNGGTCVDNLNGFTCYCEPGFTGRNCETNIDECISSPCRRGGTCRDLANSYSCQCRTGWTGVHCDDDVDECASSPCENGGVCRDMEGSYECTCEAGYSGRHCEVDIDECISDPCQNGGRCQDNVDGFVCVCMPGFTGGLCEVEIDHCESGPCQNDGSCINSRSGFTCLCHEGWEGQTCSKNINECETEPCENRGLCRDMEGSYECICEAGYSGRHCEVDIDECVSDPCQNGGRCQDRVDGFVCICPSRLRGARCNEPPLTSTPQPTSRMWVIWISTRGPDKVEVAKSGSHPMQGREHGGHSTKPEGLPSTPSHQMSSTISRMISIKEGLTQKDSATRKTAGTTDVHVYAFDRLLYPNDTDVVTAMIDTHVYDYLDTNAGINVTVVPSFHVCTADTSNRYSVLRLPIPLDFSNSRITTSLENFTGALRLKFAHVTEVTWDDEECGANVGASRMVTKPSAGQKHRVLFIVVALAAFLVACVVVVIVVVLIKKQKHDIPSNEPMEGPSFERGFSARDSDNVHCNVHREEVDFNADFNQQRLHLESFSAAPKLPPRDFHM